LFRTKIAYGMSKPAAVPRPPDGTPAKLVCTALALALLVVLFRIATVW
jgi:hypothetical protein